MPLSIEELAAAREAAAALLDEVGLEAHLFEIEPHKGEWELAVECAIDTGWTTIKLLVEKGQLLASRDDTRVRASLLQDWRDKLAACKRQE